MKHIIVSILAMIGILLTITSIHEFGHYLMLRIFHVPVKEFSIGIGPLLYQHKGTTTWSLRAIPFMAYVDFDLKNSYTQLVIWKKLVILSAGIIGNLVLALFCIITIWLNPSVLDALFLTFNTHLGIGPISFFILIMHVTNYGFAATILFLGIFSLFAGIISILPIPGFDGGWLLTTIFRIPEEKYEPISIVAIKVFKIIVLIISIIDIMILLY